MEKLLNIEFFLKMFFKIKTIVYGARGGKKGKCPWALLLVLPLKLRGKA